MSDDVGKPKKRRIGLALVALFLVCLLYLIVALRIDRLPIYDVHATNADVTHIANVAKDLNAGGHLFDWRLTQAPYIFPDIAIAQIATLLGASVREVALYYQYVLGALLLFLFGALAKLNDSGVVEVIGFVAVIYAISFFGLTDQENISLYFGLIGMHSGVFVPVLIAAICLLIFINSDGHGYFQVCALFIAIFLGAISDALTVLIFVPGTVLFCSLLVSSNELSRRKLAFLLAVVPLALIGSGIYSYLNPHPQDRDFFAYIIRRLPSSTIYSAGKFSADFIDYVTHNRLSDLLVAMTTLAYVACASAVWQVRRGKFELRKPATLLCSMAVISLPLVLFLQITLGIYIAIDSSRQWASTILFVMATAVIYLTGQFPRSKSMIACFVVIASTVFSYRVLNYVSAAEKKGSLASQIASLVNCMRGKVPGGWRYISDYWIANPISLYSDGQFGVVAYAGTSVTTAASNVKRVNESSPEYVIAGAGLSVQADEFVRAFGAPSAVYCEMPFGGASVAILDYSTNDKFKHDMLAEVKAAY